MKNNNDIDYWITVKTSKGMFSNEYAVELKLANGYLVSFFADKTLFKQEKDDFKLKVTLIKKDIKQRIANVLLPIETFETQNRWVEVPLEM